jgi:penicillin-binding protein 1C
LTIDRALDERLADVLHESLAPYRMDPAPNGAIVVLDHRTGEVLAMVGSPDYEDPRGGQWNAALALRQPGSALKPFTYALAFAGGRTPADLVADIPSVFREPSGDYVPRNYSQTFHGPVRLREALASSYNVPAVRLLDDVGSPELLELLHAAGIGTLRAPASTYGLGLTLGVGEVTLLDLCRAYALFPRGAGRCR